jgi:non-heme chloroperoxidase
MKSIHIIALAALLVVAGAGEARAETEFGEVQLPSGLRIHYAANGPDDGYPIIMLHGYSDSWFSFSRVLPALGKRYRVYALDLRGHGDSDRPATGYHMRDLATDVVAFMDAKRIHRAAIVGHSMGSFVAQQVASAAPQRVSHMVLIGSALKPTAFGDFGELIKAVKTLPEPVPAEFARDFQLSTIHDNVPEAFVNKAVLESLKLPARVWREVMKGMVEMEPLVALGRARIPTLVMRGDRDMYATAALQPPLVAMIKTARLTTYRNTGHALHWERPHEFARDLSAFLDETRLRPSLIRGGSE